MIQRGPIGQKPPKPKNGTAAARRHMAAVAQLPCLVCGKWPVEVHHVGTPRNDMNTIPLCPYHHRREFGPDAYHYSSKAFREVHGIDAELLAKVADLLSE